jgi:Flp pilus assembly pilin Flp
MLELLKSFWRDDEGQDLVEYALLLVFIGLVAITILTGVGQSVCNVFTNANTALQGS